MKNLNGTVKILKNYSFDVERKLGEWVPIVKPDTPLFTYITSINYFDRSGDYIDFLRGKELYSKSIEIKNGNVIIHKSYDANGKFEYGFSVNQKNKNEKIYINLDENMNITESTKVIYTFENNIIKSAITYDKDMNILQKIIYTIMNGKQINSVYFFYVDGNEKSRVERKYDKNDNDIYYLHIRNGNKYERYTKYIEYDKNGNWIESMDFEDKELTKATRMNFREIEYY